MREYFGQESGKFEQSPEKQCFLLPALDRALKRRGGGKLLDVACGAGALKPMAEANGYTYSGVDISPDMIERARSEHDGDFRVGDARGIARLFPGRYDLVVSSMLFPAMRDYDTIVGVMNACGQVAAADGLIVFGVAHPCFDAYMRKLLFDMPTTEVSSDSYFSAGAEYKVTMNVPGSDFRYTDYHWTLADYVSFIREAGLDLVSIDECRPLSDRAEDRLHPLYMVLVCSAR